MKERKIRYGGQGPNAFSTIFWAGMIAGTMDGIASGLFFHARLGLDAGQVMQFVASAFWGQSAFKAGYVTIVAGTVIHYLIAFLISALYLYAYPAVAALRKWPASFGLIYGFVVWLVISCLIPPLTRIALPPFDLKGASIAIAWHMALVGLPIAFMTNIHYRAISQRRLTRFARINRFKSRA